MFPDLEYMFKRVLTQEAAYHSLLSTRRTRLHTAIGLAMEELYPERLAERYEELSRHFTRGEAWGSAFYYLEKSGEKAPLAYATHEAMAFYPQAIDVSERLTPAPEAAHLLPVYEGRGLTWLVLAKNDEAIADFQQMRQPGHQSGNRRKEGESLCHLTYAHWMKPYENQMPFVEQYAHEALALARHTGDQHILAKALTTLGLMQQTWGNLHETNRLMEESLHISRREDHRGASSTYTTTIPSP